VVASESFLVGDAHNNLTAFFVAISFGEAGFVVSDYVVRFGVDGDGDVDVVKVESEESAVVADAIRGVGSAVPDEQSKDAFGAVEELGYFGNCKAFSES